MIFFCIKLISLLLGFCGLIVYFRFVVTLFFKYINPFLYLLVLDW